MFTIYVFIDATKPNAFVYFMIIFPLLWIGPTNCNYYLRKERRKKQKSRRTKGRRCTGWKNCNEANRTVTISADLTWMTHSSCIYSILNSIIIITIINSKRNQIYMGWWISDTFLSMLVNVLNLLNAVCSVYAANSHTNHVKHHRKRESTI